MKALQERHNLKHRTRHTEIGERDVVVIKSEERDRKLEDWNHHRVASRKGWSCERG